MKSFITVTDIAVVHEVFPYSYFDKFIPLTLLDDSKANRTFLLVITRWIYISLL